MKLSPIQKRAARNARHGNALDMNLVSLIDVFTILIFFLLSNSGVETLPAASVHLPESTDVAPLVNAKDDLIPGLKSELDIVSSRPVALAENAAQAHSLTIMGDKDIPYQLLRKVMYTAAVANFTNVSFAVNQKG